MAIGGVRGAHKADPPPPRPPPPRLGFGLDGGVEWRGGGWSIANTFAINPTLQVHDEGRDREREEGEE